MGEANWQLLFEYIGVISDNFPSKSYYGFSYLSLLYNCGFMLYQYIKFILQYYMSIMHKNQHNQ